MDPKALKAAIRSMESSLEMMKAACGLAEGVGEEYHEEVEDEEPEEEMPSAPSVPRMRGRRKTFFKQKEEEV